MLKDAIKFYYVTSELKDLLRQGAILWKVKKIDLKALLNIFMAVPLYLWLLKVNLI